MKPAVAYLRRSTDDKQVESLEIQWGIIGAYARENGYDIVDRYQDDGISGHDQRDEYDRMMKDAESGNFKFIIVRDQSRFTRVDAADTISEMNTLRHIDVHVVDCEEGVLDVNDFMGVIKTGIKAEQNHAFSLKLSTLTINGQAAGAAKGNSQGQIAPYGMGRMFAYEDGSEPLLLRPGQRAPKGGGGVKFLPCDDEDTRVTT